MTWLGRAGAIFHQFSAVVVLSLLAVVGAELVSRDIIKRLPDDCGIYMLEYTDANIRALYNTENPDFYREVMREGWDIAFKLHYQPFLEFGMVPYRGRHVIVTKEGFRTTPDGPKALSVPRRKVFVFGGSTTLGLGVSGNETISHALGVALRAAGQRDVTVFNLGQPGFYSTQERMLFARLLSEGHVPAAAVFIDGLNDFHTCTVPDRSGVSPQLERASQASSARSLWSVLVARSNTIKLFRSLANPDNRMEMLDRSGSYCRDDQMLKAVIRRLDSNRRMIAAMAKAFNVRTVFVHQPVPTFAYDNSTRPVPLADAGAIGYLRNSARGYPLMRKMKTEGRLFEDDVLWLEEERIAQNMYIDLVHYSPAFNRHLGGLIAGRLVGNGFGSAD